MADFETLRPDETEAQALPSGVVDRRRPGRPDMVSPELVDMLRGRPASVFHPETGGRSADNLGSMRGLAVAVLVSGVLWYGILRVFF